MAAVHPFGAFVGCQFKRIRCVHRIKVKNVCGTFLISSMFFFFNDL